MENVVFSPYQSPDKQPEYDRSHLTDALRYAFHTAFMHLPVQKSYACECKNCNLTLYTSTKRLNCEYCGSSDPSVFECKELD